MKVSLTRGRIVVLSVLLALPLTGCTSPEENAEALDLCAGYQRLFEEAGAVEAATDVDDLLEQTDGLLLRLRRIQSAADDGWGTDLADVIEKAEDLGSVLLAASSDAQQESRELISDSLDELGLSVGRLENEVSTEC